MKADFFLKKRMIILDFEDDNEFDDFIDFMDKSGYKVSKCEGVEFEKVDLKEKVDE